MRLADLQQKTPTPTEEQMKFLVFDEAANQDSSDIQRLTGATQVRLVETNATEEPYLLPLTRALEIALISIDEKHIGKPIQVWLASDDATSTMARLADGFLLAPAFTKTRIDELEKMTHVLAAIEQAKISLTNAEDDMQMAKYCARRSPIAERLKLENETLTRSNARCYGRDAQELVVAWLAEALRATW